MALFADSGYKLPHHRRSSIPLWRLLGRSCFMFVSQSFLVNLACAQRGVPVCRLPASGRAQLRRRSRPASRCVSCISLLTRMGARRSRSSRSLRTPRRTWIVPRVINCELYVYRIRCLQLGLQSVNREYLFVLMSTRKAQPETYTEKSTLR